MSLSIRFAVACVVIALLGIASESRGDDRPCGPDSMGPVLKSLVPQGFAGADFKPACRRHDACYDTPGACKEACDKKFLADLNCECENSKCPAMCRVLGRVFYASVRLGGDDAFRKAQCKARGR